MTCSYIGIIFYSVYYYNISLLATVLKGKLIFIACAESLNIVIHIDVDKGFETNEVIHIP